MRVQEWLDSAVLRLRSQGVGASSLEAQLLAGHVLRVERPWLLAHPETEFPELAGESLMARRLSGEPLAYILGYREFFGRRFKVGPGVLIPRQDTEVLVEAALEWLAGMSDASVLDLGTGSGCIATTIALEESRVHVVGSDISAAALEIAVQNAGDLRADVDWVLADGVSAFEASSFRGIVTNPPYIALSEELATEVVAFEPAGALFAGETGLEFYERLADEAGRVLAEGGRVFMEVGYRQAEAVRNLFVARDWAHIQTRADLAGVARVVVCEKNSW